MEHGQRTLIARNGVFVQVSLPWLDCTVQIGSLPAAPPLPYGELTERISFRFGVIPVVLLQEFIAQGRAGLPNEIAGGLIYCSASCALRLQVYDPLEAAPLGIRYSMPHLGPDELIAVDLHTHGEVAASWSLTDDADDLSTKVCGVFGDLAELTPSAKFRLVVNGFYKALANPWEQPATKRRHVDDANPWPTLTSMGFTEAREWNI